MLEERVIYLINAEIDGQLDAGEQAELEGVLASSEEARVMRTELRKLASLLDDVPAHEPPADLARRIIDSLPTPRRRDRFSLPALFASLRPAPTAAAFAAGLLAAVGYYELSVHDRPTVDIENVVGTIVANRPPADVVHKDRLEISAPGLYGAASLDLQGGVFVIGVQLESAQPVEIEIETAGSGLEFGGLAHTGTGGAQEESYEVSGGTLRVVSQGRKAFSVFLQQSAQGNGRDREIAIADSSAGQPVYSGVLRG